MATRFSKRNQNRAGNIQKSSRNYLFQTDPTLLHDEVKSIQERGSDTPKQGLTGRSRNSGLTHDDRNQVFHCGSCSREFRSLDSLSLHIKRSLDTSSVFQCQICNCSLPTSDLLSSHITLEHNDVTPFKCGLCDERFFENAALLQHLEKNHDKSLSFYKCSICSSAFREIGELVSHVKQCHPVCSKYKCGICAQHFVTEATLTNHLRHKHSNHFPQIKKTCEHIPNVPFLKAKKHMTVSKNITSQIDQGQRAPTEAKNGKEGLVTRSNSQYKILDKMEKMEKATNEMTCSGSEEVDSPTEPDVSVENGNLENYLRKESEKKTRKKCAKQNIEDSKQTPIIKDKIELIAAFMKVDPKSNTAVYDCDVCGERLLEKSSFVEHRDNHFFDNKFCINCVHCSHIFHNFEDLNGHIGENKLCAGYKCQTCGKSFALEPLLLTHKVKEHSDMGKKKGILTCTVCEKVFENRTAFIRHASSHSEDKCIECKLCRHAFTTQETLFGHLRTRHSLIPSTRQQYKFTCERCNTDFMKLEGLTKHKAIVHNVHEVSNNLETKAGRSRLKPISKPNHNTENVPLKKTGHWRSAEDDRKRRTCHICHRVFKRFKDVRRHIGTHTKPYLCSHCGKSFPYRYSLDSHIKAFHSADNPHRCETCNKSFSCQRSLLVHQRIHTGEKPHKCPVCFKHFRQVANLSMHIKLHNTEKPIKCELCDYRCSHQGYLKRHMSTHSKEKKYLCPICNKGFAEKPNLNHHIKRHSKIKNHVCAVCGHRFAERYYLNNHMRVHTKEKPYICPVCNRAFTMRPNMVAHIKKTHPSYKYQPIRRSHQVKAGVVPTVATQNNTTAEINMQIEAQKFSTALAVNETTPVLSDSNSFSIVSPPSYTLLQSSSHSEPQPSLQPQLATTTNTLLPYQLPEPSRLKMDSLNSLQFPTPQDLMPHHPLLPREQQLAIVNETIGEQVVRENAVMIDPNMRQDFDRHQNYVNLQDKFAQAQFDPHREMAGQSFHPTAMTSHDYMYTYQPEASFFQGFFPAPNQHNSQTDQK